MAATTKIQQPYLKDTRLDGKQKYTPKEWTERFWHYILNIDIKQILTDDMVPTDENWDTKEAESRQHFISYGAPDHQQSKPSQKESLIQTLTQSKSIN